MNSEESKKVKKKNCKMNADILFFVRVIVCMYVRDSCPIVTAVITLRVLALLENEKW